MVDKGDVDAHTTYGRNAAAGVYYGCTLPNNECRRILAVAGGTGPFRDALDPDHQSNSAMASLLTRCFTIGADAVKVSGMAVPNPHLQAQLQRSSQNRRRVIAC